MPACACPHADRRLNEAAEAIFRGLSYFWLKMEVKEQEESFSER